MKPPSDTPSGDRPDSPLRQLFLQRLEALSIRPAAREYYVRWAEAWTKACGNRSADSTTAFFDALGRSTHLADWQFCQAVDAVRIMAHEILAIPPWNNRANPTSTAAANYDESAAIPT